jgi:hypothetical protein
MDYFVDIPDTVLHHRKALYQVCPQNDPQYNLNKKADLE